MKSKGSITVLQQVLESFISEGKLKITGAELQALGCKYYAALRPALRRAGVINRKGEKLIDHSVEKLIQIIQDDLRDVPVQPLLIGRSIEEILQEMKNYRDFLKSYHNITVKMTLLQERVITEESEI